MTTGTAILLAAAVGLTVYALSRPGGWLAPGGGDNPVGDGQGGSDLTDSNGYDGPSSAVGGTGLNNQSGNYSSGVNP